MPILAIVSTGQAMFLTGLGVLVVILLKRHYRLTRKLKKQKKTHFVSTAPPALKKRELLIDAPPELQRWNVEIHEIARNLKAEITTKMVALEVLLKETKEAEERLKEQLSQTTVVPKDRVINELETPLPAAEEANWETLHKEAQDLLQEANDWNYEKEGLEPTKGELVDEVRRSFSSGNPPYLIADEFGISIQKVETILTTATGE
ncbi:MAG: hypothetical protein MPJ24_04135 [Pirellulaceae bacterium]|nr:hypothetical protein [Pirellulaceae bacterium]